MFYTKSAAARIITIATKIEAVRVLSNCIQVTYKVGKARCSVFISKKKFAADFVSFRQDAAGDLVVTATAKEGLYIVNNPKSGKSYNVSTIAHSCECEDQKAQVEAGIKNATCKHLYAAIGHPKAFAARVYSLTSRQAPTYFTNKAGLSLPID